MTATTIKLSGPMGSRFGRSYKLHLDTNSPGEAFRALAAMIPGFREYLVGAKAKGIEFAVWRGKEFEAENISAAQLQDPAGGAVRIAPIVKGSKAGGLLQTIVGAALIVVGVATSWTGVSAALVATGIGMVAGGVVQMLSPQPKLNKSADSADNQSSYVFNGPVNTSAQGNCVPVLYGRMIIGSAVISAGMEADEYSAATNGVGAGIAGGSTINNPYQRAM